MRQKLGLAFVLGVLAAAACWLLARSNAEDNALRVRELATRGLAEFLAARHPAERVLILSNPFTKLPGAAREIVQTEEAGVRGVRAGFGQQASAVVVAFPALRPEALENPRALLGDVETSTPLSYLMQPEAMDQLHRQYPDRDLFVSLVGLPADLAHAEAWTAPGAPRFALLWPDLRVVGDAASTRRAFKSGKLAAIVLRRPDAPPDAVPLRGDRRAEFEKRFVLVSAENIDEILQRYPGLIAGENQP